MVSEAISRAGKGSTAGNPPGSESVRSSKSNFGDIMAKSLNSNVAVKNAAGRTDSSSIQTAQPQKQPFDGPEKTQTAEAADQLKMQEDSVETDNLPAEELDAVEEAAQQVADKMKELLGVSDEAFEEALAVLGLTVVELLQPSHLTQVLVQLTGAENAMTLLTDPSLSSDLKELLSFLGQQTDQLCEALDLPPQAVEALIERAAAGRQQPDPALEQPEQLMPEAAADIRQPEHAGSADKSQPATVEQVIASKITTQGQPAQKQESGMSGGGQHTNHAPADSLETGMTAGSVVQQLSQTFETAFTANLDAVNPADIVRQVVDTIRMTSTQLVQSMEIQLNPENLGKVNLLVTAREGVITAQITAENEQVKRAIESQIGTLKETFENQGLKVDAVEVTVQSHGFEANQSFNGQAGQQQESARTRRKLRLDELSGTDETSEEEKPAVQPLGRSENSSVEYTA